jgi:hypothetical protein
LEWVVNPYNMDDGMMLRYDKETDVSLSRVWPLVTLLRG